jgi:4-diphosphocytidyl-2-C-methyl-D-erythritol kinase
MERNSYTRLTLSLDIVGRIAAGPLRGYHELSTIKHQIDLHDTVSIEPASKLTLECNDRAVPIDHRNICWKAVTLMQKEFHIDQPVRITIEKRIPVMGGLAGGSANAATTLQLLNDLWELHLSTERLMKLGGALGMDVPFYFVGGTASDSEAGGECTGIPTNLHFSFLLALPEFGVSTAEAYQGIDYGLIGKNRTVTERMRQFLLANDRDGMVPCIHNDFELSVGARYPRLLEVKKELVDAGCETAVLSGSGSTVIGIARNAGHALAIRNKISCRTIIAATLEIRCPTG